jgi:hypothetical protein
MKMIQPDLIGTKARDRWETPFGDVYRVVGVGRYTGKIYLSMDSPFPSNRVAIYDRIPDNWKRMPFEP